MREHLWRLPFLFALLETYLLFGGEMFWGALILAVYALYLSLVPFLWLPAGLMLLAGMLKEPILLPALVVGIGWIISLTTQDD